MDYKQAAGRNWSSGRPKRRPFKLNGGARQRLPETLPPPGRLEHRDAAGRNWTHDRARRDAAGTRHRRSGLPTYPPRERGGADHDRPYNFVRPSAAWTFPFSVRQFARLLVLRGRIGDGQVADDVRAEDVRPEDVQPHQEQFGSAA
jgi:hypothetical protein